MLYVNTLTQLQETFGPKRNQSYKTPNGFVYVTYGKDRTRPFSYAGPKNYKYFIKIVTKEGEIKKVLNTKGDCLIEISRNNLFKKENNLVETKIETMTNLKPSNENLKRECRSILNEIDLFIEDLEDDPKELALFVKAKKIIEESKHNK